MQVDQSGAIAAWVPTSIMFSVNDPVYVVLHKTAGFQTAEECAAYFGNLQQNASGVSSTYIIGLDGTLVQCVPEWMGAGANCCLESGHAPFLQDGINYNQRSISIEHIDPTSDNSTPVTAAQYATSLRLVHDICQRWHIPMRAGDASGGILRHSDFDPISRARCPGNYPFDQLLLDLRSMQVGVPQGWRDDGKTLTASNGVTVVMGFRDEILKTPWDPDNVPQEGEYNANPVLLHNSGVGGGDRQVFRDGMLWWTEKNGVINEPYLGLELDTAYKQIDLVAHELDLANAKIADLEKQIAALQSAQPSPDPNVKSVVSQVITLLTPLT